jgi:hypothetical protein
MRSFGRLGWCVDLLSVRPKSTSINKRKGGGDGIGAAVERYLQDLERAPVCAARESSHGALELTGAPARQSALERQPLGG